MKKLHSPLWISLLFSLLLPAGCATANGSKDTEQYIIDVMGAPVVLNCSKAYTFAGHYTDEGSDTVSLAVSGGDLIYFQFMDDEIFCYRYSPADGLNLSVRYDTTRAGFILNHELISVSLSEGSAAWKWLTEADEKMLAGIRSLNISLPLSDAEIHALKKASSSFSHPGLYVVGDSLLEELISVIKPGWLIAEDLDYSSISDDLKAGLKYLKLLWQSGGNPVDQDLLNGLPALRSLIIEYWDSTDIANLQWEKLKGLESISIIESEIHDLSRIASLSKISNLNIVNCETLQEIAAIDELGRLACVGFTGCKHIQDIPAILEISSLTRLSVPGNISQEEFADIISRQEAIQVLELIDCDGITDLSPLLKSPELKALTVDFNLTDPEQLSRLSGLELLVLGEDFFEDSLFIAQIKQTMPDTRIVAGGGFCLGSGWILLLLPAIVMLMLARQRFSGSNHARTGP